MGNAAEVIDHQIGKKRGLVGSVFEFKKGLLGSEFEFKKGLPSRL